MGQPVAVSDLPHGTQHLGFVLQDPSNAVEMEYPVAIARNGLAGLGRRLIALACPPRLLSTGVAGIGHAGGSHSVADATTFFSSLKRLILVLGALTRLAGNSNPERIPAAWPRNSDLAEAKLTISERAARRIGKSSKSECGRRHAPNQRRRRRLPGFQTSSTSTGRICRDDLVARAIARGVLVIPLVRFWRLRVDFVD